MVRASYPGLLSEHDYDALLRALSMSAKGRAFLSEHIERTRPDETRRLLDAIGQMETSLSALRKELVPESIAAELRRIAADLENSIHGDGKRQRAVADLARLAADLGPAG